MTEIRYGGNPVGTGSFSRLACSSCGEETLHRGGKCVHCGREHKASDTVRQVKLDSLNVHRLWVQRAPKTTAKRGRPRKVAS